ncbi:MAG: hypothetical protein ABSH31_00945 [Bryobacteraceae bacterium]|jgi:hypothetical protein
MKLGILVVYLVAEEDERLLDIHLSQIEKTTSVPFRIYAAANRLQPRFREKIESLPYLSICQFPTTSLRGSAEHAYYLDRLVEVAVADGASFICTFHVDSFPVCSGWAEKITAELRGDCVLAGVERDGRKDKKPSTEFMLFTREFYLEHRPAFRLTENELASLEYQRYRMGCPHYYADSGVGYGFKIWARGLSWFPLQRVDRDRERDREYYVTGAVYEDLIFHLGGTVQDRRLRQDLSSYKARAAMRLLSMARALGTAVVPSGLWRRINRVTTIQRVAESYWTRPRRALEFLDTRSALLADLEQLLRRLRDRPQGEGCKAP